MTALTGLLAVCQIITVWYATQLWRAWAKATRERDIARDLARRLRDTPYRED